MLSIDARRGWWPLTCRVLTSRHSASLWRASCLRNSARRAVSSPKRIRPCAGCRAQCDPYDRCQVGDRGCVRVMLATGAAAISSRRRRAASPSASASRFVVPRHRKGLRTSAVTRLTGPAHRGRWFRHDAAKTTAKGADDRQRGDGRDGGELPVTLQPQACRVAAITRTYRASRSLAALPPLGKGSAGASRIARLDDGVEVTTQRDHRWVLHASGAGCSAQQRARLRRARR